MLGKSLPVAVVSLVVLSLVAGCLGGEGGGAKGAGNGNGEDTQEPPPSETTGGIEGVVADVAFNLFVGALVAITTDGSTILKNVTTDQDGHYYAGGLAPGEYKVFASYTDHKPQGKSVQVVAGQTTIMNFVLEALPRVEPRVEPPVEISYYIECGIGFPIVSHGAGATSCGEQATNQKTVETFHIARGLTTMIIAAKWSGTCTACLDGKPWLSFHLSTPDNKKIAEWHAALETSKRFDFNLTEETQKFIYGDDGNWTLQVIPSSGNNTGGVYTENGGFIYQMGIKAYVTLAYDNYYVPPEENGIPDE